MQQFVKLSREICIDQPMGGRQPKQEALYHDKPAGMEQPSEDKGNQGRQQQPKREIKHVDGMLRHTTRKLSYGPTPKGIRKEALKTPGAFLVHDLLSPDECKQLIEISEEMGYVDSISKMSLSLP